MASQNNILQTLSTKTLKESMFMGYRLEGVIEWIIKTRDMNMDKQIILMCKNREVARMSTEWVGDIFARPPAKKFTCDFS